MSKIVQWKRGNANISSTYVGLQGEITVNTDDYSLNLHDGVTPGGFKISNDADLDVNIGNLRIYDQTITGTQTNANIKLVPLGTGVVEVPNTAHIGSILAGANKDAYIGEVFNPFIGANVFTMSSAQAAEPLIIRANTNLIGLFVNTDGSVGVRGPSSNVFPVSINGSTSVSGQLFVSNIINAAQTINSIGYYASPDEGVGYAFSTANLATGLSHTYSGNISILGLQHDDIEVAKFISNGETQLTGNLVVSDTGTVFGSFPTAFIQTYSNVNSYAQLVNQNLNAGPLSSADFVPTANNGNDSAYFGDFGIAGQNYNYPGYGLIKPNDVYLLAVGNNITGPGSADSGNLILGTTTGNINFFVGAPEDANVIAQMNTSGFVPGANVTYSLGSADKQWKDLWVSNNTIYIGSVPLSINSDGNLTVNGNVVSGGGSSPVQPYIELTNTPFITLPAILGNAVTITAAPIGNNARFEVDIGAGPVINSVTISTAGDGYTVGQRYRVLYYDIGGSTNADDVEFTITNVDETGGITNIANIQFMGNATNSPGVYSNKVADYLPSIFDNIDTGLTLTRGRVQGIFNSNSEQEYNNNTYLSPIGTEWNNDGWGDLLNLNSRSYAPWRSALNNNVGNEIVGAELVMHDTINDKYYKFEFTEWGQGNGNYAYSRELVTDPNYFKKEDYGNEVDIIVPDDGEGSGIGITRDNANGIYNPYREGGWDEDVSPAGTLWNTDGWDDLTNITTRTYDNFYAAYGNGGLGNKVPGSQAVMYVPDTGKYYAIEWFSWTQGGNGGGFSYSRKELNLDQLNEGVKFSDGTILKSAEGVGRVKATASGDRRIEEVTGNKTVSVTQRSTTNLNTVASRAGTNTTTIWIDSTASDIAAIIDSPENYNDAYDFEFSLDDNTWYAWTGSTSFSGTERGYSIATQVSYLQGDTVYFRYTTGGESVVWWDKADLPGGAGNFRGAIIDYHAYSGEATWIGTIHIADDTGNDLITHTEVNSGSSDSDNDDLWIVEQEGQIRYRRIDGEAKTLKVQWIAKVFYGSEFYD